MQPTDAGHHMGLPQAALLGAIVTAALCLAMWATAAAETLPG
jgi:hypothetical protein